MPRSDRRPTERQRRAILADLTCPIMGGARDYELARDHGVTAVYVRQLRAELARDMSTVEVTHRLEALARLIGWQGDHRVLLLRVLDEACARELAQVQAKREQEWR